MRYKTNDINKANKELKKFKNIYIADKDGNLKRIVGIRPRKRQAEYLRTGEIINIPELAEFIIM